MTSRLFLVFGSQLFPLHHSAKYADVTFFMAEDRELCTYYTFHTHKIVLFLSAMRQYKNELERDGRSVIYHELGKDCFSFDTRLEHALKQNKSTELVHFEIEDRFMEERIDALAKRLNIKQTILPSPMFLTTREEFTNYLQTTKKPFMKTFYEQQRKRLNILVDNGKPVGGQWSFDEDNRKKLPASHKPQALPKIAHTQTVREVIALTKKQFPNHPGNPEEFWLPTTREQSLAWLDDFFKRRFHEFGPYEDAIHITDDFVNHSVLTPTLNLGLITPGEVVEKAISYAQTHDVPLASLEGFIRQIIGWREFVRGIYQSYPDEGATNFWKHTRKLAPSWYTGTTGLDPLDIVIRRAMKRGYTHHIERLMIVGNILLLCEIDPKETYRWFMELYVDSSDWVMGPNVYGMSQMSDGGIFATKPYICGSAYILKMSDIPKGSWCDIMDGLYWRFIERHKEYFSKNPRLSMMARQVEKLDPERKARIFTAAEAFIHKNTLQ